MATDGADDPVRLARERLAALDAQISAARTDRARTPASACSGHDSAAPTAGQGSVRAMDDMLSLLLMERAAAHEALGQALFDRLTRDIQRLVRTYDALPRDTPTVAADIATISDGIRRASIRALADWPNLAQKAERLFYPRTLH